MSGDKDDEDGVLGRWSRRKRQADHGAPVPEDVQEQAAPAEPQPEDESDDEVLARLDLPHPETLLPGDDITRYLRAPLSQGMKQLILRRLWRSNPVLANLDGLNDYDTDFTGGGVAPGMLKSAYQVGRGYAARAVDVLARDDDLVRSEGGAPEDGAGTDPNTQDAVAEDGPAEVASGPSEDVSETPENYAEERTSRRMVFRFDD